MVTGAAAAGSLTLGELVLPEASLAAGEELVAASFDAEGEGVAGASALLEPAEGALPAAVSLAARSLAAFSAAALLLSARRSSAAFLAALVAAGEVALATRLLDAVAFRLAAAESAGSCPAASCV